ncbi:unnamed protein product [Parnassius mnemosyne]
MLLIVVAKEFVAIIDNKTTDGTTLEAKKQAWMALTNKYNALSETGIRTEKQLHALYDNLKKKARKNLSDDKSEMYKTGGGTFCPKTTAVDEKVVALLTPQFKSLPNDFDSSAPYYNIDIVETQLLNNTQGSSEDNCIVLGAKEDSVHEILLSPQQVEGCKRKISPLLKDVESTPKKKICLTETKKKKNINNISASIIKRKNQKQMNEDAITTKRLEILEIQLQHEHMKLEKTKILLDLDIDLKRNLLENAKMDF